MSWQCTSWALREAECPTATSRLVLIALADRCQPDGRSAWPTIDTLCLEAHASRSAVKRALRDLEELGTIRRGVQSLAAYDEHGRFLPEQYRPVVWECCIGAPLEHVAQKLGRQARDEREQRASQCIQPDDGENNGTSVDSLAVVEEDFSGFKMNPLENQGVQNEPSRGFASDPPIYETNIKTNIKPPIVPLAASRTSPQGQELDVKKSNPVLDADVRQVIDRLADLRTQAGLSVGQTRRDVDAVQGLLAVHPVSWVLDMLDWVYTKQASRWWVKRTRTAAAFAKVFDELTDARKLDAQSSNRKRGKTGASVVAQQLLEAENQRQERVVELLQTSGESARVCRFAEPLLQAQLDDGIDETEALQAALQQAHVLAEHEARQSRERILDDLYERAGMQWVSVTHPQSSIRQLAGEGKLTDCLADWHHVLGRDEFEWWVDSELAEHCPGASLQDLDRNPGLLRQMVQDLVTTVTNNRAEMRQIIADFAAERVRK